MKFKDLEEGKSYWVYLEDIGQGELGETTSAEIGGVRCRFYNGIHVNPAEVVEKREKVTIPKFVAEWIVEHKNIRNNRYNYKLSAVLHNGLNIAPKKVQDWLLSKQNQDTFARAWLDGYEIEEPLGVLLVDMPEESLEEYYYLYRSSEGKIAVGSLNTADLLIGMGIKVTEAEAKEKYPMFKWVSLEELEE